jgi:hypothetical protein
VNEALPGSDWETESESSFAGSVGAVMVVLSCVSADSSNSSSSIADVESGCASMGAGAEGTDFGDGDEVFFAKFLLESRGRTGRAGCTVVRRDFDLNVEPLAGAAIGLRSESIGEQGGRNSSSHPPFEMRFESVVQRFNLNELYKRVSV